MRLAVAVQLQREVVGMAQVLVREYVTLPEEEDSINLCSTLASEDKTTWISAQPACHPSGTHRYTEELQKISLHC